MKLLSQVYALCIFLAMPAAIFSAPLEVVGEIAGNGIDGNADEEIILSVSTIVNGVKKSEAAAIVSELERLGEDIKSAAFEAFMLEVTQKAMTVQEVKEAVEAVKVGERGGHTVRPTVTHRVAHLVRKILLLTQLRQFWSLASGHYCTRF